MSPHLIASAALAATILVLTPVSAASDVSVSASDVVEFPSETAAIVAATSDFFAEIEDAAAPSTVPQIRIEGGMATEQIAYGGASNEIRALLANHGPMADMTGYRINWYPTEHLSGAVDFMGTFDDGQGLVCGFLVWDLSDPDAPVLDTVVADYLIAGDLAQMDETDAQVRLLNANCAHSTLAPNFALLSNAG